MNKIEIWHSESTLYFYLFIIKEKDLEQSSVMYHLIKNDRDGKIQCNITSIINYNFVTNYLSELKKINGSRKWEI